MLFLPITYAVVCWQDNETQYRLCDAAGEVYKNFYDMCESDIKARKEAGKTNTGSISKDQVIRMQAAVY